MVEIQRHQHGLRGLQVAAGAIALALHRGLRPDLPLRTFRFSITYLMSLFAALILDHYVKIGL